MFNLLFPNRTNGKNINTFTPKINICNTSPCQPETRKPYNRYGVVQGGAMTPKGSINPIVNAIYTIKFAITGERSTGIKYCGLNTTGSV